MSHSFPFTPSYMAVNPDVVREEILKHLPPAYLARCRAEKYFAQATFLYVPVQEDDFWELVYHPLYHQDSSRVNEKISGHSIALLFIVLALGAHLDLDGIPCSAEAMQYYQLSRASLGLESVLERPSLEAIQAMVVIAHFLFLVEIDEPRWMIMGLVTKMIYSVCISPLHFFTFSAADISADGVTCVLH